MHRAVALAGDEQFVTAISHVHGLAADFDRRLFAKRRRNQADGIAVQTCNAEQAPVGAIAGNLSRLGNVF